MAEFVPADLPTPAEIIPPAIDPRNPKNLGLPHDTARQVLEWIGVRTDKPLVTQVSRFDPWKDPLGVIAACRLAREEVPDLQLALVGSMATDDPEGWDMYRAIRAAIAGDKGIHIFTNLVGVGNVEVNAFQALSKVVIQKSLREGFGLVVAEALWKGTPVVAGRAGGIPLQMADDTGGILVDGVEDCARAMVALLRDPERAHALGASGRERVRRHFLIPRLVLDELSLMRRLATGAGAGASVRDDRAARPGLRHGAADRRGDPAARRDHAALLLPPVPRQVRRRARPLPAPRHGRARAARRSTRRALARDPLR